LDHFLPYQELDRSYEIDLLLIGEEQYQTLGLSPLLQIAFLWIGLMLSLKPTKNIGLC